MSITINPKEKAVSEVRVKMTLFRDNLNEALTDEDVLNIITGELIRKAKEGDLKAVALIRDIVEEAPYLDGDTSFVFNVKWRKRHTIEETLEEVE